MLLLTDSKQGNIVDLITLTPDGDHCARHHERDNPHLSSPAVENGRHPALPPGLGSLRGWSQPQLIRYRLHGRNAERDVLVQVNLQVCRAVRDVFAVNRCGERQLLQLLFDA